ncbi:DNA cytosine methyltransferase [Micromonospora tarensis]|uniref:Cytosine-specific methyltransferase n=1 Tax=Micromonospora tarensis TaxID=2806100 RepID=A0ABS1YAN5_9ACTN|nr:DNA cytosine methyltransferase [Micromonospora tarensis]MBM0274464.1 DNA cytosine methyltransferase [Micromonospora tarensis]
MATYGVKLQRSDDLRLLPREDSCSLESFPQWCEQRLAAGGRLAVDLFSGAGGLSQGLTDAGWTVAAAVDHDRKALDTHRANFPGLALDVDLGDDVARAGLVRLLRKVNIDLVAGGPPCQPFSRAGRSKIRSLVEAGKRDEEDHRKELWRAFVDVVLKVRPRAVLMENVPDMALGDEMFVVRTIVATLEQAGYRTQVRLVDAWRHGVPQHRQRLILLARRDDGAFTWPEEAEHFTTLREAIHDLPRLQLGTGGRRMEHRSEHLSPFAQRMRRNAENGLVFDHMTRPVRDDDRKVFALMTSKTLYSAIDPSLRRYTADTFDDKYKRLDWDDRSRSITAHIAKDGYWYIHPEEHRTLTVREAARIQTFPDSFRFAGTRSDAFRQIGNAVPPMLGEAAALALMAQEETSDDEHREWGTVRKILAQHATRQRLGDHWYLLPSQGRAPALAALVAMIGGQPGLGATLEPLRDTAPLTRQLLERVLDGRTTSRLRNAVERLAPLLDDPDVAHNPDQLEIKLRLRAAETDLFRLLLGEDRLVPNQTATRVAARVVGSDSHTTNRLTAGRLDLALLVGSGVHAASRMAAVRLLGATVCRTEPSRQLCRTCPLRNNCHFGARFVSSGKPAAPVGPQPSHQL